MNENEYSKAAMKRMLSVLPFGTMQEIADKLDVKYTTVTNVCYGKHYHKDVIAEVERRYQKVKKSLA